MGWALLVVVFLIWAGSKTPQVQRAKEAAKSGAGTALFWLAVLLGVALALKGK